VARAELQRAITRVSRGVGVRLLTDMFGGTPTDIASMFLDNPNIEVVTGVNLPMILKLADQTANESLADLSRRVREAGHEGIHVAGELLTPTAKSN
jgi:PTS system mannose-specific IIA component